MSPPPRHPKSTTVKAQRRQGNSAGGANRPEGPASLTASTSRYQSIYAVVRCIPPGRVASYGQIAFLAGMAGRARLVGYALGVLRDQSPVPWHRVVNVQGRISPRRDGGPADPVQRLLLEGEGVCFDEGGRIPLERFLWKVEPDGGREPGS